jgi:peptidoglycan/xylan/chitin deacetylase (PgdA/CDA1 family)
MINRKLLFLIVLFFLFFTYSYSYHQPYNLPIQTSKSQKEIAITIDDLPGIIVSPVDDQTALPILQEMNKKMLAALVNHRVPAIGFVNEVWLYRKGQETARINLLRSWLNAGLMLGNHTYEHLDFNKMSLIEYQDQVTRGEIITRKLMKERGNNRFYIRFPFNHNGNTKEKKEAMHAFLKERGYTPAPFTIEHSDYIFNEVYSKAKHNSDVKLAQQIRNEYLNFIDTAFAYFERRSREVLGYEPKQIFLIHVNEINAECLPEMLARIKKRGYSFISLDEAMKDKAYQIEDQYLGGAGISWIHRWSESLGQKINNREEPDPPQFVLKLYQTK